MEQTVRSFFVVCTVPPSIGDKLKRRQYRRIEKGILEFNNKSSSWHSVNTTKGLTFLFQAYITYADRQQTHYGCVNGDAVF